MKQSESDPDDEVKKAPSDTPSKSESTPDIIPVGVSGKSDLDPEALHKAFKFAAWSSIILVSLLLPYNLG